jgi:hypothetical protein
MWWEKEEVKYVAIPFFFLAIFLDYFMLGVLSSVVATFIAFRIRRGKPEGYLVHLQYAMVPKDPKGKGIMPLLFREQSFPNSIYKHIIG